MGFRRGCGRSATGHWITNVMSRLQSNLLALAGNEFSSASGSRTPFASVPSHDPDQKIDQMLDIAR